MTDSHPLQKYRILITGGSGFIGTNLVEHFHNLGCEVKNFDKISPRNPHHLEFWHDVDMLNEDAFKKEIISFDPHFILHFAARTDLGETRNLSNYSENYLPVKYIIQITKKCKSLERIIFASSQLIAQIEDKTPDEEYYSASTLYGTSKIIAEQIVRSTDANGIPWTIVRPTSIWGPWFATPYREFFDTIKKGYYFNIGGTDTRKQWGYIGNVVYQIEKVLIAPLEQIHRKTFYLADFSAISLKDFANAISQKWNNRNLFTLPYWIAYTIASAGNFLQKLGWKNPPLTKFRLHNIVSNEIQDLSALEKVVGPLPYNSAEGIQKTVQWMRDAH